MIFATGPSNGNPPCRRAFTLIELILVLTLLAIAAALITPALSNFLRGRALDSEARRLLSLTHAAQSRAVSEGVTVWLWLDVKRGAYGVTQETQAGANDPRAQEFLTDENVQLAVLNLATVGTLWRHLPAIQFLTDGSIADTSPATVRLSDSTGATLYLTQTRNRMGYEIRQTNQ